LGKENPTREPSGAAGRLSVLALQDEDAQSYKAHHSVVDSVLESASLGSKSPHLHGLRMN
jgi:hypothetical protein